MNKIIAAGIVGALILPGFAFAQSTDTQAQYQATLIQLIQVLTQKVEALQAQLDAMTASEQSTQSTHTVTHTDTISTGSATPDVPSFSFNVTASTSAKGVDLVTDGVINQAQVCLESTDGGKVFGDSSPKVCTAYLKPSSIDSNGNSIFSEPNDTGNTNYLKAGSYAYQITGIHYGPHGNDGPNGGFAGTQNPGDSSSYTVSGTFTVPN